MRSEDVTASWIAEEHQKVPSELVRGEAASRPASSALAKHAMGGIPHCQLVSASLSERMPRQSANRSLTSAPTACGWYKC